MLADRYDVVIGVDTHKDSHAFAVVEAASGSILLEFELPANRGGYRAALAAICDRWAGERVWALEGSRSYGAGLARYVQQRGERVREVERPRRNGLPRAQIAAVEFPARIRPMRVNFRCMTMTPGPLSHCWSKSTSDASFIYRRM
jgi:transposase